MGIDKMQIGKKSRMIIFIIVSLLLINAFKFSSIEGNNHPLFSSLFNMIILILFLIFFYHRNDLLEEKNDVEKETK